MVISRPKGCLTTVKHNKTKHTAHNDTTNPQEKAAGMKEQDPDLELFLARKRIKSRPLRWLLVGTGCTTLGLGILGIPLPILPTTPFLLVSAWCFGRSSEPLLRWLLTNRVFGEYLRGYVQNRGIPGRVKLYVLILLWATILLSAFLAVKVWWLRIMLIGIAAGVTIHVLRIRTSKPESK